MLEIIKKYKMVFVSCLFMYILSLNFIFNFEFENSKILFPSLIFGIVILFTSSVAMYSKRRYKKASESFVVILPLLISIFSMIAFYYVLKNHVENEIYYIRLASIQAFLVLIIFFYYVKKDKDIISLVIKLCMYGLISLLTMGFIALIGLLLYNTILPNIEIILTFTNAAGFIVLAINTSLILNDYNVYKFDILVVTLKWLCFASIFALYLVVAYFFSKFILVNILIFLVGLILIFVYSLFNTKYLTISYLALNILSIANMVIRIYKYGITPNRYIFLIAIVTIFLILFIRLFIAIKVEYNFLIILFVSFIAIFAPYINFYDLSVRSLDKIYQKYIDNKPLSKDEMATLKKMKYFWYYNKDLKLDLDENNEYSVDKISNKSVVIDGIKYEYFDNSKKLNIDVEKLVRDKKIADNIIPIYISYSNNKNTSKYIKIDKNIKQTNELVFSYSYKMYGDEEIELEIKQPNNEQPINDKLTLIQYLYAPSDNDIFDKIYSGQTLIGNYKYHVLNLVCNKNANTKNYSEVVILKEKVK